ncbi:MAG: hypothetical protein WDK95_16430 [Syntrophorhabdaceae bacterium]
MKQYTTEWATEVMRKNDDIIAMYQDENLYAHVIAIHLREYSTNFISVSNRIEKYFHVEDVLQRKIGKMLEHPDGWQNSLVTREDI